MPGRTLLSVLLLLSSSCAVWCATLCNNRCCSFLEGFPARLKVLRENYSNIREYYEANDDLDLVLIDQSIVESFKTPFACHVMDGILKLYLDSVLPRALASVTVETRDLQPHVESIQQILDQLKTEVNNCKHFFACKNQFDMNTLTSAYTQQMQEKGLFKAMGELDLLFNYIEMYMSSKTHRNKA
uniref:Interleukin family protein n=1 Tax=Tetraodon nigroviridis TaxID=99883 RepID=H3CPB0_TETNG